MENSVAHFLKMSGMVPPGKRKEFEQTSRFVSHQLSPDCLQFSFSTDIFISGRYHFYSLWPTAEALTAFRRSQEFQILEGAYKTLGSLETNISGEEVEIQSFHVTGTDI
jgi:quinol monooxygenase YgiN